MLCAAQSCYPAPGSQSCQPSCSREPSPPRSLRRFELASPAAIRPGRATAVGGAVAVKHNLQLARGEPAEERAVELLVGALQAHPQFQAATWPDGMMRPMFCRYLAGMKYGDHVDGAIMGEAPDCSAATSRSPSVSTTPPNTMAASW